MIVSTTEIFRHAYGRYAVGAYNFNNLEQLLGIFRGHLGKVRRNDEPIVSEMAAPFIVQLIPGALEYSAPQLIQGMLQVVEEIFPEAIYSIHLDHGTEEDCYACIASGVYRSVMVDASYSPFEENVAVTRRVVERAHERGVAVEAELGEIGGQETERDGKVRLTHPDQAVEFIERTGCDSPAVAIGTSHGAFKFAGANGLHWERLQEIQRVVPPQFPLVLHGASAVPQEWIARINAADGKMQNAKGCNEEEYSLAARYGVCKINIDTDGRLVWYGTHREFFRDHPQEFDLRSPGKSFMEHYACSIQHKSEMLGSVGEWRSLYEKLLQTTLI